jgi:hypothetical protein
MGLGLRRRNLRISMFHSRLSIRLKILVGSLSFVNT